MCNTPNPKINQHRYH